MLAHTSQLKINSSIYSLQHRPYNASVGEQDMDTTCSHSRSSKIKRASVFCTRPTEV